MDTVVYSREVLYYETDRMGIVHNSNYLRYFEEARLEHMKQSGLPYIRLEEQGIIIPQTEAHVKYESVLRYGDSFRVEARLTEYTGVRIGYEYRIVNAETGKTAAEGKTGHCFLDDAKRTPVNLKKRLPEFSAAFENSIDR
ncbi:MAG: acyl-CoA thioesterase [Oscillospiraceae bacterium]|nr:acyl-CoA thioesterase [Oscillospiraceae bacterium]